MNKTETILISIHPLHVSKILSGVKRFELRRRMPSGIKRIVIYSTAPESRITAVADIEEVLTGKPDALWEKVRGAAGVDHGFYQNYFSGRREAFALRIGRVAEIMRKIRLPHSRLPLSPPQSFCYLNDEKVNWLLDCAEPMFSGGTRKIFIGGVHASGKSFLCEKIISSYGYGSVSASTLIKEGRGEVVADKTVSDIEGNQRSLLNGLRKVQKNNTHLVIDGHFCLLDKQGHVKDVPLETFAAINPGLMILASPAASFVGDRLAQRAIPIPLKGTIDGFMKREQRRAKCVAKKLGIKLEIVDTGNDKEWLHLKISRIIKNM